MHLLKQQRIWLVLMISLIVNITYADDLKSLIERYEGRSNNIYYLQNKPHIGIGHLIQPNEFKCLRINKKCYSVNDGISDQVILDLYNQDIKKINDLIDREIQVNMTDNQRKALISYVYNVGYQAFYIFRNGKNTKKDSKFKILLNSGDYEGAKNEMDIIRGDGIVLNILKARREEERQLWSKNEYNSFRTNSN